MAVLQAIPKDGDEGRVHERLAAGKPNQLRAQPVGLDLIEISRHLSAADIGQPIILRRRLDIAIGASDIAKRAGIDPKRLQRRQLDKGAGIAAGGEHWIYKLSGIKSSPILDCRHPYFLTTPVKQ